jgi:hypothetical protein
MNRSHQAQNRRPQRQCTHDHTTKHTPVNQRRPPIDLKAEDPHPPTNDQIYEGHAALVTAHKFHPDTSPFLRRRRRGSRIRRRTRRTCSRRDNNPINPARPIILPTLLLRTLAAKILTTRLQLIDTQTHVTTTLGRMALAALLIRPNTSVSALLRSGHGTAGSVGAVGVGDADGADGTSHQFARMTACEFLRVVAAEFAANRGAGLAVCGVG